MWKDEEIMPLNTNKLIETSKQSVPSTEDQILLNSIKEHISNGNHVIIVDGQPKKINKQSRYLLDMLTLE